MTGPTPKMFDHAVKVYAAMDEEAVYVEEEDLEGNTSEVGKIYTGHLTSLFQKLELAVPYYTSVMKGLKAMGCVEQLRRGGGNAESQWFLNFPPTEEGWIAYEDNKRASRPQGKVEVVLQRVQNHEERLLAIENYLQSMKV